MRFRAPKSPLNFYVAGGSLQYNAPSYIERQADHELLAGLLEGEFCYVLTARQMGKSSLMVRTANRLREAAIKVAALDLTAIGGQNVLPDQWYRGLLDMLGQALDLEDELDTFWHGQKHLGPSHRFTKALRQVILARLEAEPNGALAPEGDCLPSPSKRLKHRAVRLVIFVDEIDFVRSLPFPTDEFFAAIRECYNHRTLDAAYEQLTFCLLGVASPSDLIRDTRTTPFNIGRRIELNDFARDEVAPLATGLQIEQSAEAASRAAQYLARIFHWTEGHPYLTQKLCRVTAETLRRNGDSPARSGKGPAALVDNVCEELFLSHRARERDDNLIFVRERLLRDQTDRATLLDLYQKVWRGKRVVDNESDPAITLLRLAGVVRAQAGRLRERNRIYARVFNAAWVRAHMPDPELRRQRAAFQRGVVLTLAISLTVVMVGWLLLLINQRSKEVRTASAFANYSKARAERVSGRAGRRLQSLAALKDSVHGSTRSSWADLRDEAIACLALTDLRPTDRFAFPGPSASYVRSDSFDRYAVADRTGTVSVSAASEGLSERKILSSPGVGVQHMRFSRDNRWLAVVHGNAVTNFVAVWDWQAVRQTLTLPHEVSHEALDFTADGEFLAVGRTNGTLVIYALSDGRQTIVPVFDQPGDPRRPLVLRASPSLTGTRVALICTGDQQARVFDLRSPRERVAFYHGDLIRDVAWHPRGDTLATACDNGLVYLWAIDVPQRPERTLTGHEGAVVAVTFSRRGDLIAASGTDRTVRLWTTATQSQFTLSHEGPTFTNLQFSADDCYLEGQGETNQIWEVVGGEYRVLDWKPAPSEEIKSVEFSPDSRLLLAATNDRLLLWDPWTATLKHESPVNNPAHSAVFLFSTNEVLVSQNSGLYRRTLTPPRQWPPLIERNKNGSAPRSLRGFGPIVLSAKARRAVVSQESSLLVFDVDRPAEYFNLVDERVRFERLAISQNGRWLAAFPVLDPPQFRTHADAVHIEKTLRFWNLETGQEVSPPEPIQSTRSFAFSPDDNWLVVGRRGFYSFYAVGSWQLKDPSSSSRKNRHDPGALLAFAREANLMAIADSQHAVRLFRLRHGISPVLERVAQLEAPERSQLSSLALSPNGEMLVAVTQAGLVRVWNLAAINTGLQELGLGGL